MEVLFLDAPYRKEISLCKETVDYLKEKGYCQVGLYASVQFCNQLEKVKKQLEELGIKVVSSKADRTHVSGQLLGCDVYHDSLNLKKEVDCYLYVGDGKFHPLALAYMQKERSEMKEIICNDPMQKSMQLLDIREIKGILQRYNSSLITFLSSGKIGVIVTIKPGQEQLQPALALEKKYPHKKFYYFLDDTVSFQQLENFNFIDVWINTTCPRVGFDDQEKFVKGVINLNDALEAVEILSKNSLLAKG